MIVRLLFSHLVGGLLTFGVVMTTSTPHETSAVELTLTDVLDVLLVTEVEFVKDCEGCVYNTLPLHVRPV